MAKVSVELDQQINSDVGEGYGTVSIRVVVVSPKPAESQSSNESSPVDEDDDIPDDDDEPGKGPLASYLEKKSYGKWCAVFLVNGQRHHAWDNTFISRDLEFKFLRDRTMVVVDLDNLSHGALSEIMQGSRQGLYEGKVFTAIRDRIIQTLKSNPELKRLQVEAEQKALEMRAGDAAVKSKLDQLIEGHHATAEADGPRGPDSGQQTGGGHFGDGLSDQSVIVMGQTDVGEAGSLPALATATEMSSIRLYPGQTRDVVLTSLPREAWATIQEFRAEVVSEDENLTGSVTEAADKATVTVSFGTTDYDDEDYPVLGELRAFARFDGHLDPRVLSRPIVVNKKPDPPQPIELLDNPTFLKVRSRQPVRLVSGGAPVHVRLVWNGKPSLLRGSRPKWHFSARCVSLSTFPRIGFGYMNDGRLSFILYPPNGLITGGILDFEVVADGPNGQQLRTAFRGLIIDPPQATATPEAEPRRVDGSAPPMVGQRRPPYELKYISHAEWGNPATPCFQGGGDWGEDDAGCFLEPSPTQPLLLLVINQDMELLKSYREGMVKRRPPLDPNTIKERTNKYISHVAFHLYQMYNEQIRQESTPSDEDDLGTVRAEKDMRSEINRVGTTLMKMMEVSR